MGDQQLGSSPAPVAGGIENNAQTNGSSRHRNVSAHNTNAANPYLYTGVNSRFLANPIPGFNTNSQAQAKPRQVSNTVKERLMMFETQQQAAGSLPKPPLKIPLRNSSNLPSTFRKRSASGGNQYTVLSPGDATRSVSSNRPQTTQRNRFVDEDSLSNNHVASSARTGRPVAQENSNTTSWQRYKAQEVSRNSNSQDQSANKQPLFGEVVRTSPNGPVEPGWGISNVRPRPSSESSIHIAADEASRSGSPSDWYRTHHNGSVPLAPSSQHNRSQSASTSTNVEILTSLNLQSRLPVPSKSSQVSTRVSRDGLAQISKVNGQRPFTPAQRSTTPTHSSTSKSGLQRASPGRELGGVSAYIHEADSPKQSPPLRNSRARTSVADATTASSRNRAVGRYSPTDKSGAASERLKPRLGPVDYGAGRLRVQQGIRDRIMEKKRLEDPPMSPTEVVSVIPSQTVHSKVDTPELEQRNNDLEQPFRHPIAIPGKDLEDLKDGQDSPTLGIPGSYPVAPLEDDARSTNSGMTEFDTEPQTEAPSHITAPLGSEIDAENANELADGHADVPTDSNGLLSTVEDSERRNSRSYLNHAQQQSVGSHHVPTLSDIPHYRSFLDSRNSSVDAGQGLYQEIENSPTLPGRFPRMQDPILSDNLTTLKDYGNGHLSGELRKRVSSEDIGSVQQHSPDRTSWLDDNLDAYVSEDADVRRTSIHRHDRSLVDHSAFAAGNDLGRLSAALGPSPADADDALDIATLDLPGVQSSVEDSDAHESSTTDYTYATTHESSSLGDEGAQRPQARHSASAPASTITLATPSIAGTQTSSDTCVEQSSEGPPLSDADRERLAQRLTAIKEFVDTEALYLRDMHVFEEIYKGTADVCPTLTPADIDLLFRNIDRMVAFTSTFLHDIKVASSPIYVPRTARSDKSSDDGESSYSSMKRGLTSNHESKDRQTRIAAVINDSLADLQLVYGTFLARHEEAQNRIKVLEADPAVKCWLDECDSVAKDLTGAWNIDSLWSKPLQRITKLPLSMSTILKSTPKDHPEYEALTLLIPKLYKVLETVNKATPRARSQSSAPAPSTLSLMERINIKRRTNESSIPADPLFHNIVKQYADGLFSVQFLLRDIELYCQKVSEFVHMFTKFMSSIELVVRATGAANSPLEAKWISCCVELGTMEKTYLKAHLESIKANVIIPIEFVCGMYVKGDHLVKKRYGLSNTHKKFVTKKKAGSKIDKKTQAAEDEFQKLTADLKRDLPIFSDKIKRLSRLCYARFIEIMLVWYNEWQQKMNDVLRGVGSVIATQLAPASFQQIAEEFSQKFEIIRDQLPPLRGDVDYGRRSFLSQSSQANVRESGSSSEFRASSFSGRARGVSGSQDAWARSSSTAPSSSVYAAASHGTTMSPELSFFDRRESRNDQRTTNSRPNTTSNPTSPEVQEAQHTVSSNRPSTARSYTSEGYQRRVTSYNRGPRGAYQAYDEVQDDGFVTHLNESFGLFSSAMPMDDAHSAAAIGDGAVGNRQSRTSSYHREVNSQRKLKTLYMAASLFEFNFDGNKSEAGYPYLTYPAGDIFDILAEKGELWLAKNNEDPTERVGWIWSKHFARFASSPEDAVPAEEDDEYDSIA